MAYDVTLVQFDGSVGGFVSTVSLFGFPSGNFNNLLFSYWMCIPKNPTTGVAGTIGSAGLWMGCGPTGGINFDVQFTSNTTGEFFRGTFGPCDVRGVRSHCLLSVNCATQTAQMYVNDQHMGIVSGGWEATGAFNIDPGSFGQFKFNIGALGGFPAAADIWSDAPASFFDLTVTANRRKFINADLSPVDLGTNGSNPLGHQPAVFMTVPTGGVANDFLANHGHGGPMILQGVGPSSISLQAGGICTLPPPPPAPPPRLAIDNVVANAQFTQLPLNLISLRFSDDRGHSWGSPVTIPMGEAGEYRTSLQYQRLGMARDRCFELSWSVPCRTALQGAWIDVTPAQS